MKSLFIGAAVVGKIGYPICTRKILFGKKIQV
jgi:hypothetical protein